VNGASVASSAGGKGAVDLSSTARHLANLQNSDNDINVVRVNEIRDALASGQLKIDPSRIADGLIASVRDLLK
jgi:negative regulator of flagellin synthesis FlgM